MKVRCSRDSTIEALGYSTPPLHDTSQYRKFPAEVRNGETHHWSRKGAANDFRFKESPDLSARISPAFLLAFSTIERALWHFPSSWRFRINNETMYNNRSHPLLAQIPLTVSPFITLPTAPTLPYTYKPLPSTLPPSSTADASGTEREKYVVSLSGHAASPEEIIASCQALQAHIQKVQEDAERTVREWEQGLKAQELAEKRRVAPGWLDREEKILEPERGSGGALAAGSGGAQGQSVSIMDQQDERPRESSRVAGAADPAGDELDRAFGGMGLRNG